MSHGDSLHLMAGTVDTTGSGGADGLAAAAVVSFASGAVIAGGATGVVSHTPPEHTVVTVGGSFDGLLADFTSRPDAQAAEPYWEQTALFDPATLEILAGARPPAPAADPEPVKAAPVKAAAKASPVKAAAPARNRQRPSRAKTKP